MKRPRFPRRPGTTGSGSPSGEGNNEFYHGKRVSRRTSYMLAAAAIVGAALVFAFLLWLVFH